MIHVLKTDPQMWQRLAAGQKTFELRRDDRGFQAGDELRLFEFDPKRDHECNDDTCSRNWHSAQMRVGLCFRVGFVAKGTFYGLALGEFAILSLLPIEVAS